MPAQVSSEGRRTHSQDIVTATTWRYGLFGTNPGTAGSKRDHLASKLRSQQRQIPTQRFVNYAMKHSLEDQDEKGNVMDHGATLGDPKS
jgi:hypothetical protein